MTGLYGPEVEEHAKHGRLGECKEEGLKEQTGLTFEIFCQNVRTNMKWKLTSQFYSSVVLKINFIDQSG